MKKNALPFLFLLTAHAVFFVHVASGGEAELTREFLPGAALRNHVLLVNVGHALPDGVFAEAAQRAFARVQINVWTNAVEKSIVGQLVSDPGLVRNTFGEKASIAVFIERNEKGASFLQTPGAWSMVNLRGTDRDGAAADVLADRYAKMILKGLVHACGGGASLDPKCTMFYGSFTLAGMDKTGLRVSPYVYFPVLETIRQIGGEEILSPELPAVEETE